ncbi:MAG TPA: hypothetical protein VFG47_19480, partial [Geminicoccaceae bacterium]|nr:hypothetical protein [Geminicoccaceae bacterium]
AQPEGAQPAPGTGAEAGQAAAPAPAPPPDLVPEKEIAARIAAAYGVEVLAVKRDDLVGGPAYAVRVMQPGGNSNAAFQVSTLMVDATTGELIPQFRHRTAGYQVSGSLRAEPPTAPDGTALRRRTHWSGPRLSSDPGPR